MTRMLYSALALATLAAVPVRATVWNVTVGGTGLLAYTPNTINAAVGDQILFTFKQKNHTVTQSTFASPCSALDGGFDTGFMPVADDVTSDFPTQLVNVNTADPIWIYCRQTGHCAQGMVFAVNPGDNFAAFQAAAEATGNGTSTVSSASTTSSAAASVVTVTATVTVSGGDVVTTTYGSYPGSSEPTAAAPANHQVTVGANGQLVFSPSNITAQPGDSITFQFMAKNHTATQSSFGAPCVPLGISTPGSVGFDSGFQPVSANATDFPSFTVTVNDTKPIWVYCRQTGHCGQGMVFSANAVESGPNNFAAFQALAEKLNGTASSTSSGSSPSSTSAAIPMRAQQGGVLLAFAGFVLSFLL